MIRAPPSLQTNTSRLSEKNTQRWHLSGCQYSAGVLTNACSRSKSTRSKTLLSCLVYCSLHYIDTRHTQSTLYTFTLSQKNAGKHTFGACTSNTRFLHIQSKVLVYFSPGDGPGVAHLRGFGSHTEKECQLKK